ncbi:hypothetical protein FDENT_8856 [Fusarium denticulatum]|uniref:C2H2-type domain-containing protein n=1 Tax=Fusarium denticulatum TaxID=48507 RepID=A0A8H5TYZ1_9HYPO|nr:hypothetical protein FDENT_8856 [Fusarium denticulatum]
MYKLLIHRKMIASLNVWQIPLFYTFKKADHLLHITTIGQKFARHDIWPLAFGVYPSLEVYGEMTDRGSLHDGGSLRQKTASSAKGKYSEDIGTMRSKPTLLPKGNSQEQLCKEGRQKDLALSDDKGANKTLNSKRRADGTKGSHERSRTSMTADTNKRLETFACPYYRKDPERHLNCINLKLIRISDVKQHLKRRHTSNYSCTRCFEGFSSSKSYEEHVLLQSCPIAECNNNDGVSPVTQQALKDRVDRSSSPEQLNAIKNNNEPFDSMQDWPYSASLDTSDSIFNYDILPDFQDQQIGCPFMNLSTGLHHPDDGRNWHSMSPNSITAMENIVAHQVSMENFAFTEDDLHSAQMPDMFD